VKLHRQLDGSAGPHIVLLHGGFGDLHAWDAHRARLAAESRLVLVDLRGYGASHHVTAPWTMVDCARDVVDVLREDGISSSYVVGFSQGAMVALELSALSPTVLRGLVLVSGTSAFGDEVRVGWVQRAGQVGPAERDREVDVHTTNAFSSQFHQQNPAFVERYGAHARNTSPTTLRNTMIALATADCGHTFSSVTCPTLVVRGSEDPIIKPVDTSIILDGIPGSRFREVRNAGHNLHLEQPDVFVEMLLGFVRSIEARRDPDRP
jgi:3-oxoadipate enol-lactonase